MPDRLYEPQIGCIIFFLPHSYKYFDFADRPFQRLICEYGAFGPGTEEITPPDGAQALAIVRSRGCAKKCEVTQ